MHKDNSNTKHNKPNVPYFSDGDSTLRKKDPKNPDDWRESDAPNVSQEENGWQKSNEQDDTIREPMGTLTTGERGNVINSATWDPKSHLSEEDVAHVDVNNYKQSVSPENQTAEQKIKFHEQTLDVEPVQKIKK